jgi:phosphonate transport system substrate-binding protein
LARRYEKFATYLSNELNVNVQFKPSIDYSAVVVAFSKGDLDLAFFGGLTGVQARIQDNGAQAIAQRQSNTLFQECSETGNQQLSRSLAQVLLSSF